MFKKPKFQYGLIQFQGLINPRRFDGIDFVYVFLFFKLQENFLWRNVLLEWILVVLSIAHLCLSYTLTLSKIIRFIPFISHVLSFFFLEQTQSTSVIFKNRQVFLEWPVYNIHNAAHHGKNKTFDFCVPKYPKCPKISQNISEYLEACLGLRAHAHTCACGQFEFWIDKVW